MKLQTSANVERTFTLEVELEGRNEASQIKVLVGFDWEYDCNPGEIRGIDFLVITETIWESEGFTCDEMKEVEAAILSHYQEWLTEAQEAEEEGRLNCD